MRVWIDTDVGENPDDTIALWIAGATPDVELIGVSIVDGNAPLAQKVVPGVDIHMGAPPADRVAAADVLVGIGPWTNIAALADIGALPRRVVLMGGTLAKVWHRNAWYETEHNVSRDPAAAARLLATVGNLIVVPLDATARLFVDEADEKTLIRALPSLEPQLQEWRARYGDVPIVLHDPATVLIAFGEPLARTESRRLRVEPNGTMRASVDGPVQHVVAHIDGHATRARVRALATKGD
jgi:inosine-uridine nucleoside N-ribohydrolase